MNDPLIWVLLASAALLAIALGEDTDDLVVLGVVVLNAVIGFVQLSESQRRTRRPLTLRQGARPDAGATRSRKRPSLRRHRGPARRRKARYRPFPTGHRSSSSWGAGSGIGSPATRRDARSARMASWPRASASS